MQTIHVYTSDLASVKVADLTVSLQQYRGWNVVLRPLDQLPPPQSERLNRLLLEQRELAGALATTEWCLEQFASGQWQPDAALQNGLQADKDALATRLRAVECSLVAVRKGAGPHA